MWRLALLAAALDQLHHEWPRSVRWPVAFAGISGGAKRTGFMAAMLATTRDVNVVGMFLCGINDDRISAAYRQYKSGAPFLDVPIWLSSGIRDPIAPPLAVEKVEGSLQQTGFKRVRLERFDGRHEVKQSEVRRALRWFRELGGF